MAIFLVRRIAGMIPSLILLVFVVVAMLSLIPGSIIDVMLGADAGNIAARAALKAQFGLDHPLWVQFIDYMKALLQGNLGTSYTSGQPVLQMLVSRLPVTIEIGTEAIVLGTIVGTVAGVIAAVQRDRTADVVLRLFATFWTSVPSFVIGSAFVVFPAIWWGVTLRLDYVSFASDPLTHLQIIGVPVFILALGYGAWLIRLVRTQMLEVLQQDYIRTARAKGMGNVTILLRHALKNALIPVVTVLGLQVAVLLSGSVIIENIFGIPGAGRLLTTSIQGRDYPVVQGIVLVLGVFVMAVNLIVDISYAWLDPRIKFA